MEDNVTDIITLVHESTMHDGRTIKHYLGTKAIEKADVTNTSHMRGTTISESHTNTSIGTVHNSSGAAVVIDISDTVSSSSSTSSRSRLPHPQLSRRYQPFNAQYPNLYYTQQRNRRNTLPSAFHAAATTPIRKRYLMDAFVGPGSVSEMITNDRLRRSRNSSTRKN